MVSIDTMYETIKRKIAMYLKNASVVLLKKYNRYNKKHTEYITVFFLYLSMYFSISIISPNFTKSVYNKWF